MDTLCTSIHNNQYFQLLMFYFDCSRATSKRKKRRRRAAGDTIVDYTIQMKIGMDAVRKISHDGFKFTI